MGTSERVKLALHVTVRVRGSRHEMNAWSTHNLVDGIVTIVSVVASVLGGHEGRCMYKHLEVLAYYPVSPKFL